MQEHSFRAITLFERMAPDELNDSNDRFWALAKYAENVQESVKELDRVNCKIYPALIEFEEKTWKDLKGMRDKLVHKFWEIDPAILELTVSVYFPALHALLSSITVFDRPVSDGEKVSFEFETKHLLALPGTAKESGARAGHSLVVMVFGHNGKVGVFRVGHDDNNRLVMGTDFDTRLSIYGKRKFDGLG